MINLKHNDFKIIGQKSKKYDKFYNDIRLPAHLVER